jgi:hypothetical protein
VEELNIVHSSFLDTLFDSYPSMYLIKANMPNINYFCQVHILLARLPLSWMIAQMKILTPTRLSDQKKIHKRASRSHSSIALQQQSRNKRGCQHHIER